MKLAVVIPARDSAATLDHQLAAVAAQRYEGEWAVVVVDHGSVDSTASVARGWEGRLPGLQVLSLPRAGAVGSARNAGAAAVPWAEGLLFTDSDDTVEPGWVAAHGAALATGRPLVAGALRWTGSTMTAFEASGALETSFGEWEWLPHGIGTNLSVARSAFDAVGGWNPELRYGCDDKDLCWRLQLRGYPIHFEPSAVVTKSARPSSLSAARQFFGYGRAQVLVYRLLRAEGMPRSRLPRELRALRWIATRWVFLYRHEVRVHWVRRASMKAGRWFECVRSRTVYL
jgi:glycosyltransferase involved in cell wall biosynthesis